MVFYFQNKREVQVIIMNKKMIVNEKEYELLKLLGKGKGGYSYLT